MFNIGSILPQEKSWLYSVKQADSVMICALTFAA